MFLHGTKERMGATETEQMVLDEAVGNNQLLSGWRGEPNVVSAHVCATRDHDV